MKPITKTCPFCDGKLTGIPVPFFIPLKTNEGDYLWSCEDDLLIFTCHPDEIDAEIERMRKGED